MCQPRAPSGAGRDGISSWRAPVPSVARTEIAMVAGRRRPTCRPIGPRSHPRSASTDRASCHVPSMPTSTFDDAAVGRPRDSGDRHPTGRDRAARRVDPRLGQDRPLLGPAERHPVAVERLPGRELELPQPLGRGHVAEQAGHDQPGRVAVLRAAAVRRSSGPRSSARARGPSPTTSACPPSSRRPTVRRAASPARWARRDRARRAAGRRSTWRCRRGGRRPRC